MYIPNFITSILYTPFMDQRVANIYANILLMVVCFKMPYSQGPFRNYVHSKNNGFNIYIFDSFLSHGKMYKKFEPK